MLKGHAEANHVQSFELPGVVGSRVLRGRPELLVQVIHDPSIPHLFAKTRTW